MTLTTRYPTIFLCALFIIGHSDLSMAMERDIPFVAGFERFGRHGEIESLIAGRLLLSELSCTACHRADDADLNPKRGPQLDGAGNRLRRDWIAKFLANPQLVKPGTTMPAMLNGLPEEQQTTTIRALVAFIGSQQQPYPEIKGTGARPVPNEFWNSGDVQRGRQLFHRTGCVACHEPDNTYETVATQATPLDDILAQLDPEELEEAGLQAAARRVESVPLGDLASKYTRKSLTFFLMDPHQIRPAARMPNFQLGVVESADIAAWLLREQPPEVSETVPAEPVDAVLVKEGRQLFGELGCANCHSAGKIESTRPAKPLIDLNPGSDQRCTESAVTSLPDYSIDDQQQDAIDLVLTHQRTEQSKLSDESRVQLTTLRLNCLACHERNKQGGVGRYRKAYFETYGNVDIGDEGRLPPPLTGVGRKLTRAWIERVLQGKGRVREHMRMTMPVFANEQVKALPALLSSVDGIGQQPTEQEVFGDQTDLAEAGRQLLDTGCVQCHLLRGESVPGTVGIDLEGIASRVQPQWFHDFVLDPGELKPHTRMPSFFPQGKSQNPNILNGDTERQIAAMWVYLKGIVKYPLPAKIQTARSQNYELKPTDRPLILRTFMEQAGTHAIAVGFPDHVHFAFDAEQIRLAQAWRGRFLDVEGTWFVRSAPPAVPLGKEPVNLPKGISLAYLQNVETAWPEAADGTLTETVANRFLGYRLDRKGVPTFLYRVGDAEIEDRIESDGEQQLMRRLTVTQQGQPAVEPTLWLRAHTGETLKLNNDGSCVSDARLRVSLQMPLARAGAIRSGKDGMEWIVPLATQHQQTIEVRYQW